MRICLDLSPAAHQRAGIGRYARELVLALSRLSPPPEISNFTTAPGRDRSWRARVAWSHLLHSDQDRDIPPADLFHATDHVLPRLARMKSVLTVHDLSFRLLPQTHTWTHRAFLAAMMPRFLAQADAILCVSESTRRDLLEAYRVDPALTRVVHPGVNARFKPSTPEEAQALRRRLGLPDEFILYLGTIEPRKNLGVLVDALGELRRSGKTARLVIAGARGWMYGEFFSRLRSSGLEGQIQLAGFIPEEDLPALYTAASVFAYPSLHEGFGSPVAEALACGVPIVCSRSSSLPEVAGDAALLVEPREPAAWAAALGRLLGDAELRTKMSASGLARAREFTWEKAARETMAAYREVLG